MSAERKLRHQVSPLVCYLHQRRYLVNLRKTRWNAQTRRCCAPPAGSKQQGRSYSSIYYPPVQFPYQPCYIIFLCNRSFYICLRVDVNDPFYWLRDTAPHRISLRCEKDFFGLNILRQLHACCQSFGLQGSALKQIYRERIVTREVDREFYVHGVLVMIFEGLEHFPHYLREIRL